MIIQMACRRVAEKIRTTPKRFENNVVLRLHHINDFLLKNTYEITEDTAWPKVKVVTAEGEK